jgi:hypothetical protein
VTRLIVTAIVSLSVGATACGGSAVEAQWQHVVERTTPPHQTVPRDVTLDRRGMALEATWEMQTDLTWEQYAAWVAQRLSGEYSATPIEPRTVVLSKYVDGDRYAVTITAMSNEQPLLVRLQFRVTPD